MAKASIPRGSLEKYACLLGPATVLSGLLTIVISILSNPWFDVLKHALSDMGRVGLSTAWIFNGGLLITSLLALGYAYCLANIFSRKLGVAFLGIYIVAAVSLALIAIFPEGTDPHYYVSLQFFILMTFNLLLFGIALLLESRIRTATASISMFILSLVGSVAVKWPSIASIELYNVAIYAGWFILMFSISRSSGK